VPEPRTTTAPPARQATAILAIICISYFMVILDNSIIFTGLPRIEAAMRFSPARLTWVQDAYTLVFGGLLLLGARAGDIAGRRRMFTAGLVLFGLASLLVGAAPAAWWLVSARAVQGVGAAILAPSSLALLTATFPEGRQPRPGHRRGPGRRRRRRRPGRRTRVRRPDRPGQHRAHRRQPSARRRPRRDRRPHRPAATGTAHRRVSASS
jgi:hypothetical protein